MALVDRVVDKKTLKLLTCEACHDIFANPRTLTTCNHVFCLLCITNPNPNPNGNDVNNQCPVVDCKQPYNAADISSRML